jgi:hypothetical protein
MRARVAIRWRGARAQPLVDRNAAPTGVRATRSGVCGVLRIFPRTQNASSLKQSALCLLIMGIAVQSNRVSTFSNMAIADSARGATSESVIIQPMSRSMPSVSSRLWRMARISAKARARAKEKSARVARMLTEPLSPRNDLLSATVIVQQVATASTWVSWGIAVCNRRAGSAPPSKCRMSIVIYDTVPSHLTIGSGSQESNRTRRVD